MKSFNEEWERIHSSSEWGQYPSEHVIRFVARNYYKSDRKSVKILDFGCGSGAHTWYLAREGFDVYAFDGSKTAVERTRRRLAAEGCAPAHLKVMDAAEVGYESDFFDAVIDSVCIYANTIDMIKQMYSNCFCYLKKGGKLFTSVFTMETDGAGSGNEIEYHTYINEKVGKLAGRGTVHYFDKEELGSLLSDIGFQHIQVDTLCYTDNDACVDMLMVNCEKE